MRARVTLLLGLLAGVTGCMHAARVFLDIPEGTTSARARSASEATTQEQTFAPRAVVPDPAPVEAVESLDSVLALLPSLPAGGIDWMTAWDEGVIRPRAKDEPAHADSAGDFSYDLYLSTGDGPEAYFPHSSHRAWMSCESCHPRVYRNGGDSYSREGAHEVGSCGTCHGPVAFGIQACEQCHEAATGLPAGRQEKSLSGTMRLNRADPEATGGQRIGQGYDLTGSYPPARFPHGPHRLRYQCRACHEKPFPMIAGATVLSQEDAHSTQGCGLCHDGVTAFGADLDSCQQCHSRSGG